MQSVVPPGSYRQRDILALTIGEGYYLDNRQLLIYFMTEHYVDNGNSKRFNRKQWNNVVIENIKKVVDMISNIASI